MGSPHRVNALSAFTWMLFGWWRWSLSLQNHKNQLECSIESANLPTIVQLRQKQIKSSKCSIPWPNHKRRLSERLCLRTLDLPPFNRHPTSLSCGLLPVVIGRENSLPDIYSQRRVPSLEQGLLKLEKQRSIVTESSKKLLNQARPGSIRQKSGQRRAACIMKRLCLWAQNCLNAPRRC